MWHVSSRSGVATLRTAVHLLLTYLLTSMKLLSSTVSCVWIVLTVYNIVILILNIVLNTITQCLSQNKGAKISTYFADIFIDDQCYFTVRQRNGVSYTWSNCTESVC